MSTPLNFGGVILVAQNTDGYIQTLRNYILNMFLSMLFFRENINSSPTENEVNI